MTNNKMLIAIISGIFLVIVAIIGKWSISSPEGKVLSPEKGATVDNTIRVNGSLKNIPSNAHLWLAIQIGNLYWVKEPEIQHKSHEWSVEIHEGSPRDRPGREFSLDLFMVDDTGHTEIGSWLNGCKTNNSCPGLEKIPGSVSLLSIVPVKLVPTPCSQATIVLPVGARDRALARSSRVAKIIPITWEPSQCSLTVQYYQHNRLVKEYKNHNSGTAISIRESGETEIKIWPSDKPSDSIWVWAE